MDPLVQLINKKGDQIFLKPEPLIPFKDLISKVLSSDTYRAFHRITPVHPIGPKELFENFFLFKEKHIINELQTIETEEQLNSLEIELCKELKELLKPHIKNSMLISYNKLRKPMDIAIEHFLSMALELEDCRGKLVKHLYQPLDGLVFQSEFIFTDYELNKLQIKRNFTFSHIQVKSHYNNIQDFLKEKALKIGLSNRIYFDLKWGERYTSSGKNLLDTNSARKKRS